MKAYVCHYSKNKERRKQLENDPRFKVLTDVTWIDWYDKEDIECDWVKKCCHSPLNLSLISLCLKHFEALLDMVKNRIPEALVFEDDVVFIEDWYKKLVIPSDVTFLRLDSVIHLEYDGQIKVVEDLWPSEAQYFKLEFAEFLIKRVSFSSPYDNYLYTLIKDELKLPVYLLPLCSQTSILDKASTLDVGYEDTSNNNIYDYRDIKLHLVEMRGRKNVADEKFFIKYGRQIDIKHLGFI
jgi:GR25 family glycosyltransferase involved in LPS biosynthesis